MTSESDRRTLPCLPFSLSERSYLVGIPLKLIKDSSTATTSLPNKSTKAATMGEDFSWMNETPGKKTFWQRAQEDPLVPFGCAVTFAVLIGGLATFQRGHSKLGNKFMQARVIAQTGTIMAMGGGAFVAASKKEEEKKRSYEERLNIQLRDGDK